MHAFRFGGVEAGFVCEISVCTLRNTTGIVCTSVYPLNVKFMFDPLSSTAAFGGDETPSWPTTPHPPNSPIPTLRRASPAPPTPEKGPSPGLYGKEPQIYGQPEAGLISPRDTVSSNGTTFERKEPYLRARITGLDRNRRDILVKLDAQVRFISFPPHTMLTVARPTSPISQAPPTEMCHGLTSSFSSFMSRLFRATLRPSYLRCPWHSPLLRQMRKMTVWSKSCSSDGSRGYARTQFCSTTKRSARSSKVTLDTNLLLDLDEKTRVDSVSFVGECPMRMKNYN